MKYLQKTFMNNPTNDNYRRGFDRIDWKDGRNSGKKRPAARTPKKKSK